MITTHKTDDGGPAFPHSSQPLDMQGNPIMENHSEWGMSIRDWFAGQALKGILANEGLTKHLLEFAKNEGTDYHAKIGSHAYAHADAMIRARQT